MIDQRLATVGFAACLTLAAAALAFPGFAVAGGGPSSGTCWSKWQKSSASGSCNQQVGMSVSGGNCHVTALCRTLAWGPDAPDNQNLRSTSYSGSPSNIEDLNNCDGHLTTDRC